MYTPDTYKKLDELVMQNIALGTGRFFNTIYCDPNVKEEVARLAKLSGPRTSPERILDRRLQSLRKAKKITFSTVSGWRPKEQQ